MSAVNIMIVEDERIVALDLQQQLTALGYQVQAAVATGEAAIQRAGELNLDLVLMDVHLDGSIDGISAAQTIHERFNVPIVFLTAYADDTTLRRARETLPFGYLVKPCEPRELNATLQMALSRRNAEAALQRSEERLRLALDAAELAVWEWETASGHFVTMGHTETLLGAGKECLGETLDGFLARVHPDDRAQLAEALRKTATCGASLEETFRACCDDGQIRYLTAHARAYELEGKTRPRVVGVVKDVTKRREMEEQLRRAAIVFETTAAAVFIMGHDHRIVAINPAFYKITGYSESDAIGKDPDLLLHTTPHAEDFYITLTSTGGGQWTGEVQCQRENGEHFAAWESISAVRDAAGNISHYVGSFADISALRHAQEQLRHLAHHDPLTGLANRLLFHDRLEQALTHAQRYRRNCALLFLDLDGFKNVNDTLGHDTGDQLLKTVAMRIREVLRRHDTAARLGGDEFLIIAENLDHPESAAKLAGKLLRRITQRMRIGGQPLIISASIGIAVYPSDGTDRHSLLRAADTAMYSAKKKGRNRFCFYTPEMAASASDRMLTEQGLQQALERSELTLHYQPLIRLNDGAVTGIEALLRWNHPEHGLLLPQQFMGVAEESGLISELGKWVLHTACREAAQWRREGGPAVRLTINVSAQQFSRDPFDKVLSDALHESGFPADQLELEIKEGTLQALDASGALLQSVKALGVGIAVDDFGSGYSSLSALKHQVVDRLKIDRSFVHDINEDDADLAIVEAVANLGHALKLSIVAEGIENETQRGALQRLGCQEGQGYLFSRPLPLHQLAQRLNDGSNWRLPLSM